ncbi:CLUMA_CG020111, isoform A [Clunio marinus]|uniref:CLUMA_CG020111, isoform A n=1 Tax=Clunio marinus TaxID=568069 RepID=A0A1J1J578_9DIPT|nr:CLUMA_CG020111, isoform A [Clunio marinus]
MSELLYKLNVAFVIRIPLLNYMRTSYFHTLTKYMANLVYEQFLLQALYYPEILLNFSGFCLDFSVLIFFV